MKIYLLKITEEDKQIIEEVFALRIYLCKETIHDNIYFKDKERVKEGKKELEKIRGVLRKVKKTKQYQQEEKLNTDH